MSKLTLEVFRDGHAKRKPLVWAIEDDIQGNIQTLAIGAQMVRADATQPDIRAFVLREIVKKVQGHDYKGEIAACFEFARDGITYRKDPVDVERVADLWSTMYALNPSEPEGDCFIKCVALATCLAAIGHRPFFIPIQQIPNEQSFNHVYVGVFEGESWTALDPTPEFKPVGWEPSAWRKRMYRIFED